MPVYEYECQKCKKLTEAVFSIINIPEKVKCSFCNATAKKILSYGTVLSDDNVPWLVSATEVLQPSYERRIKTRSEYKKYLKERDITPIG